MDVGRPGERGRAGGERHAKWWVGADGMGGKGALVLVADRRSGWWSVHARPTYITYRVCERPPSIAFMKSSFLQGDVELCVVVSCGVDRLCWVEVRVRCGVEG